MKLLLWIVLFTSSISASAINTLAVSDLSVADSLYQGNHFKPALDYYFAAIRTEPRLKNEFEINFKIARCLFHTGKLESAKTIFESQKTIETPLPEYTEYFLFRIAVGQHDSLAIDSCSTSFYKKYSGHFLADSITHYLADFYFKRNDFKKADKKYIRILNRKSMKSKRTFYLWRIAQCRYELGQKKNAYERMYQIMKKYRSSEEALQATNFLEGVSFSDPKYFFARAEVYLQHGWLRVLQQTLQGFIATHKEEEPVERARYFLLRVFFARGDYQSALYGFQNMLNNLKDPGLESRLRIYIARCYLRLDKKDQAANAYLTYADKFPRRRLASETTWKAGWLYEEMGRIDKALECYQTVLRRWRHSTFRREARFREGLSYFRLNRLSDASSVFSEIAHSRWSHSHRNRANFWLAKTYRAGGDIAGADSISIQLGLNLFEDYYTLKSYLLEKDKIDSLLDVENRLNAPENPLDVHYRNLDNTIAKFKRLFKVRDIMNIDAALSELSGKRFRAGSLAEWVALAEVYKRLGAFNLAYRTYDYVNYTYFTDQTDLEKPFILKEKYPLYYDDLLELFCSRRGLDKNFVLAIIREESSYNQRAHSWANAYGLMQIIPRTAKELASEVNVKFTSTDDLFDAKYNLNLGTRYVQKLLRQYKQKKEWVLAAYNAGPHRVARWSKLQKSDALDLFVENVEFSQTRNYVKRVMRNYWVYAVLNHTGEELSREIILQYN